MKRSFGAIIILCFLCHAFCNAQSGNIYTFAGNGTAGFSGDGGLATAAQLNNPSDVFKDAAGNFYIADRNNHKIRKVNTAGIISTIAGTGTAGYSGDGGLATAAKLKHPNRVFVDGPGNIYIADEDNDVIRMINTSGIISTIAGTGVAGFTGDGGPAVNAELNDPTGVAVDLSGNIFISDHGESRIRKVDPTGIITTYAGGGAVGFTVDGAVATTLDLCGQNYVSVDNAGNIYITNFSCWHFLKVTTAGLVYNVAGFTNPNFSGDCGPADSANIMNPMGICPDNAGNIYLCPRGNKRVRRVNSINYIETVAGTGTAGYTGDGGPATSAEVSSNIYGIYADPLGNVYFADQGNNVIRNFFVASYNDTITICRGGIDNLSDSTGPGTFLSNDTTIARVDPNTGVVTGVSPGNTVIIYNGGSCPQFFVFIVTGLPPISDSTVCKASTITLTDNAGNGTWSSSNAAIATINAGTGLLTGIAAGLDTIIYTLPDGCYTTQPFKVKSLPVVALGNDTTLCVGDTLKLLSVQPVGAGYLWSSGSTADSVLAYQTGTYWLKVTDSGCVARDTIQVQVNPIPVVNLGNDTTLCLGVPFTLQSSVVYTNPTYSWSTGATTASIAPAATNTYWLAVTIGGCTGTDTTNITFNNSAIFSLGNDTTICDLNGQLTIGTVQPAGSDYLWSNGDTTNTITVSQTGTYWLSVTETSTCVATDTIKVQFHATPVVNLGPDTAVCEAHLLPLQSSVSYSASATYLWSTLATTPSINVATIGTYWLNVTDSGCTGMDTVAVGLLMDSLFFFNHDTMLCRGAAIQVNAIGDLDLSYQWIPGTGMTNPHTANPIIIPDTSVTYTLIASVPGCPDIIDSFHVDVQPTPVVYLGGNRGICQFDTIHINAYFDPPDYSDYTLTWTPAAGLDNTNLPNVVYSGNVDESLVLSVMSPVGCIGRDSLYITVHPGNFAALQPGHDTDVCPHDSVRLTISGGVSFTWSPGLYLTDSTIANPIAYPIASQDYSVVVSSQYGCKDTLGINITVHPAAVINLPDSIQLYPGETYQLEPFTNCTGFYWFPPNGLSSTFLSNPIAAPQVSTTYILDGTTEWNCRAEDSIHIFVNQETLLAVPNAFTPGTGANNQFRIIKRGLASLDHFRVFDRWGVVVFETTNIDEGWDGSYKGKPQPFGVYVYDIEAATSTGQPFTKTGNVTLVR